MISRRYESKPNLQARNHANLALALFIYSSMNILEGSLSTKFGIRSELHWGSAE